LNQVAFEDPGCAPSQLLRSLRTDPDGTHTTVLAKDVFTNLRKGVLLW